MNIDDNVKMLEDSIGYVYENKNYALIALTHSSYAYEHGNKGFCSNERVEFLGDSVLNFIVTNRLFREASDMPEGEMSKMRASVVSEASLSKCAKKLKIGDILLLGKGERIMGGGKRNSILADAMEAIIGSLFLDSGLTAAEGFIFKYLSENYKKALQQRNILLRQLGFQQYLSAEEKSPSPIWNIASERCTQPVSELNRITGGSAEERFVCYYLFHY